jgi:hypothetical protein
MQRNLHYIYSQSELDERSSTIKEKPENHIICMTWSSYKEHKVDALALGAEEGRSDLRKATGSRKQASIRGYPNGETRRSNTLSPYTE